MVTVINCVGPGQPSAGSRTAPRTATQAGKINYDRFDKVVLRKSVDPIHAGRFGDCLAHKRRGLSTSSVSDSYGNALMK